MKFIFGIICFSLLSITRASDFASAQISGWNKEVLAYDHLRFSSPARPDYVIHLHVDSYDPENHWDPKNLSDQIKKMEKIRTTLSFFMGIKDYKITHAAFSGKRLELEGSYSRWGDRIHFKEINFYHLEHFLQLKIISESKLPSSKLPSQEEINKIIAEINPEKVDID